MTEQETILAALRDRDSITLMEAAALMPEGIRATTHVILRRMEQDGELVRNGDHLWSKAAKACPPKHSAETQDML